MRTATATCVCTTCGETFAATRVCASGDAAERFRTWAADNITECDACRKARLAKTHEAENQRAAETATRRNFPNLQGTEKQIAWATTIRDAFVTKTEAMELPESPWKEKILQMIPEELDKFLAEHTNAGWWIDRRKDERRTFESLMTALRQRLRQTDKEFNALCQAEEDAKEKQVTEDMARRHAYDVRVAADKITLPGMGYYGPRDNRKAIQRFLRCDDAFLDEVMAEVQRRLPLEA